MNLKIVQFFAFLYYIVYAHSLLIHTNQGHIKGATELSRAGRSFYAFYGIPYAEPPVGNLRFQDPKPAKPWTSIRDGTVLPPKCISVDDYENVEGEEDCLYLNVYTPNVTVSANLPVMVFIYGGRYMYGDALPSKYGPHYFMDKDVVLITFHYRLGILGFLSTEDTIIPGNYGLKDAVEVLRWVQANIRAYGGDPTRVTLMGGSSGAASAGLSLISPIADGLFHRCISQSGSPMLIKPPGSSKQLAWRLANYVGCDQSNITTSADLLECYRRVPSEEIVKLNIKPYEFGHILPHLNFGPVIESEEVPGAYLIDEPRKLLSRKTNIPWIMGFNSQDGGMMAIFAYFSANPLVTVANELTNYKEYFPQILGYRGTLEESKENELSDLIKNTFFGDSDVSRNPHAFSEMITNLTFVPAIKECVKLYNGNKYVYYYAHKNEQTFAPMYAVFDTDMGVIHGDELISMFNWSEIIKPVTKGIDLAVSEQVIELWTNFAAYGDPNGEGEQNWKPVQADEIDYLHIENGIKMDNQLFKSGYNFLNNIESKYFRNKRSN